MKASIVISTLNRDLFLRRTLGVLEKQTYKNFEVIVVCGPSTDNTNKEVEAYKEKIKIVNCDVANLCISRNIGIKNSSGDIICFIDDDCIPNKWWLENIVNSFTSDDIAGVGGIVYNTDGDQIQFKNGYTNIWCEVKWYNENLVDYNDSRGEQFNYIPGGNAAFRRKVLQEVGGFDEYIEYFADESDLAVRIIKKGYKLIHNNEVIVYHASASSHIRKSPYHLNWFVIAKNTAYIGMHNSLNYDTEENRIKKMKEIVMRRKEDFLLWKKHGHITQKEYNDFVDMLEKGLKKGITDGIACRHLNYELENNQEFLQFSPLKKEERLNICLLSEADPLKGFGGVSRYTLELADEFVKKGHVVHIMCSGDAQTVLNNGITYHYIKSVPLEFEEISDLENTKYILGYSYQVMQRQKKVAELFNFDIIESPLWHVEGYLTSELLDIPVVTRLETPFKMIMKTFGWENSEDFDVLTTFEYKYLNSSDALIYISENIKDTINSMYGVSVDQKPSEKIFIGLKQLSEELTTKRSKQNDKLTVFFIGRLERRKGMQNILDAIPAIVKEFSNIEFRIAGNNEIVDSKINKTFKSYFEKEYRDYTKYVKFLGMISDEEKEKEMAGCDIFISPSLYESFGIIFLEAMRHSKPVIGCRAGGMQEIIIDNETGILVPTDDTDEFAKAVIKLARDKDKRQEMGKKGFERFINVFSIEKMYENTFAFYKKVLKIKD